MEKGVLTLAVGKKYNRMARCLAYSCILHSPVLPRAVITDDCKYFKGLYDIIIQYTEDMGDPFNVKLKLNKYSPFYETLFLDADTLVYSDICFMWNYFEGQSVVYNGSREKMGKWYVNEIADILKKYNIPWIGKLNSGIFLFKKDETGMSVMNYAAELHKNHDGLEIPFFYKKMLPDEPFWAIALGRYNQSPIEKEKDFGRLGRSLLNTKDVKLNIIKGISSFKKDGELVFPAVVHFAGTKIAGYYYLAERLRLLFYYKDIPGGMFISNLIYMFISILNVVKPLYARLLRYKH